MKHLLNKYFKLEENNSSIRQEIIAGMTSFFTVSYIIIINPLILEDAGIPLHAGMVATVGSTIIGSFLMGFRANAPVILTPGMGVNAFFTYTIVQSIGLTWQEALMCVLLSGIIFFAAAHTSVGEKLFHATPNDLKHSITVGIGLLLTFIGLQKGQLIQHDPSTFVALGDLRKSEALLTLLGLFVALSLFVRQVKGSLLISIAFTTLVSLLIQPVASSEAEGLTFHPFFNILGNLDINPSDFRFWSASFSLAMIIIFENMGLLHGMLNDRHKLMKAFQMSSISSILSGLLGTSPTISAAESNAGVAVGGKTGLTAIVASVIFGLAILVLPVISIIPESAIAPTLIIVGGLMLQNVRHIQFNQIAVGFPAFLIIAFIPLTQSIADGMAIGFITYPILQIATGNYRKVPCYLYVISGLFCLNILLRFVL